jgi:hypothetical protein
MQSFHLMEIILYWLLAGLLAGFPLSFWIGYCDTKRSIAHGRRLCNHGPTASFHVLTVENSEVAGR